MHNLNAPEGWESKPESQKELEGIVEREPVDGIDQALKDTENGQYILSAIRSVSSHVKKAKTTQYYICQ